jgi:WD40 repeat protein
LAKPWHRRRALWIFRDQTGLAVTPGLWSSIQKALDGSEWFVLLASPEAARSQWVNREIEHWVASKPADRILPVVTNGEWEWDRAAGDFAESSTAVPAALRGVFAEEPLFLDLRWARDDRHLSLRHSRFRDAIAQLAAPMHGVSKDDLEGEDVRQHRLMQRLRMGAVTTMVVLSLVASLAGLMAVRNGQRASAAATEALRQQHAAAVQKGNADRSAGEAKVQEANARSQEKRARDAAAEAKRQEENARKQAENARKQGELADRAATHARQQEQLARQQREAARRATDDATQQKKLADDQEALARKAADDAAKQKQIAQEQRRLADEAAADAARQKKAAEEQEKLAKAATEEARKQQANADRQQRIAIGRRVNNEAKALADDDMKLALRLGVAAAKVQSDDEARRRLAGMVTSTHFAGSLDHLSRDGVRLLHYSTKDVLVTEDHQSRVRLWNVADWEKPTMLADLGRFGFWSLSPDGRTVAGAIYDRRSVVLVDVTKPSAPDVVATIPVSSGVHNVTFSQDGRTLFLGVWDKAAHDFGDLWDLSEVRRPKPLANRFDGSSHATDAAFSPDGNTMVTLHENGSTGVWNLTKRTEVERLATLDEAAGDKRLHALAFLRHAPILVAGGDGDTLLIDLSAPAQPKEKASVHNRGGPVNSVIVSSDGRRLVTGDRKRVVTVFDMGEPWFPEELVRVDNPAGVRAPMLSPDGRTLITYDVNSIVTRWNVAAHGAPQSRAYLADQDQLGLAAAFNPDGRSMLTVGSNPQAAVWDLTDPSAPVRRATPTVHDKPIQRAAATPDGRILATADEDGGVRVSDLTDPARPVTVAKFVETGAWWAGEVTLKISPDGRTLALGNYNGVVVLWDVTRGRSATRLGPLADSETPVAFSPDGRTLVVTSSERSATSLWTLDGPAGPAKRGDLDSDGGSTIHTIDFSPDGRTVALASHGTVTLWDVSAPRPREYGRAITSEQGPVVFSPDSRTMAIVGAHKALLWDVADRGDLFQVAAMPVVRELAASPQLMAAFSPDGRSLVTGGVYSGNGTGTGGDGTATLWDLTKLGELRTDPSVEACAMVGRGLTEDEWDRYIPELPHQPTCPR